MKTIYIISILTLLLFSCTPVKKIKVEEGEKEERVSFGVKKIYDLCLRLDSLNGDVDKSIIRDTIDAMSSRKPTEYYILKATQPGSGTVILSPDGSGDGENILESLDYSKNYYIKEIIDKAIKAKEGEVRYHSFKIMTPRDLEPVNKIAEFIYYHPEDWVIISIINLSDMQKFR
jgi:hypothetical protein